MNISQKLYVTNTYFIDYCALRILQYLNCKICNYKIFETIFIITNCTFKSLHCKFWNYSFN